MMHVFSMRKKIPLIVCCLVSALSLYAQTDVSPVDTNAEPEAFTFKYRKDDSYPILSKVHEDVLINNNLNHHAEILTRISVKVTGVAEDGSGTCSADFMTAEDSTSSYDGTHFSWGDEYSSVFTRSPRGIYTMEDTYFMPVVRDDPVFPEYAVKPGDTWTAPGYEAHDLRRTFGIEKPFKVPFTAAYEYKGTVKNSDGRRFNVVDVRYNLYYESPKPGKTNDGGAVSGSTAELMNRPAVTTGYSHQTLYWDNERGELDHYSEEFRIIIETFYGDTFTFRGTAEAEVTEFTTTNTDDNMKKVQDIVNNLGLENVTVKKGEKGLTISLDKIQFLPDSSELRDSEKVKLQKIAGILHEYDNDLLVTGHAALRGTAKERKRISEERAGSVAQYLITLGVRDAYHIFTQGKGATDPVSSNDTEEGRALNRRVEITIMDE
ncbi:MAG TPA: OmpA family protein [Treponema sp.]|nr:OmpA family protein [Treponema sp.]